MTAEEIHATLQALDRRLGYAEDNSGLTTEADCLHALATFVAEIAAQLAELNRRMKEEG